MNKKIYLNDKYLLFAESAAEVSHNQPIRKYDADSEKKSVFIKKVLYDFLEVSDHRSFTLLNITADDLIAHFKKEHYYIEAAGGFIEKEEQYLFIHRHGRWDLPKGKLEQDETIENAAVRECEEECGISDLSIDHQLSSTFHVYPYKKSFALKQSYWFYMKTGFSGTLVPQVEESIDQVRWFNRQQVQSVVITDTYYTITDVVNEALSLK